MERERIWREIAHIAGRPILYIDPQHIIRFANKPFLDWIGRPESAVLNHPVNAVFSAEASAFYAPLVDRALQGEMFHVETLAMAHVGSPRHIRVSFMPDRLAGVTVGVFASALDIEADVQLRQQLSDQERELRLAVDGLPYPLVYIDRDYKYQLVNQRVAELFDMPREKMLNRDLREVFGEKRFNEARPFWDRALAGETVCVERQLGTNPQTQRWMSVQYTPRRNAANEVIGLYSAATDIDALKRTELNLRHANWLLTSHFENTPLAVIEWDSAFAVRRWSPQAEKMFGWEEHEVLLRKQDDWKFVVEGDKEQAEALIHRLTTLREPRATSLHRNYRKDGRVIWCEWYNSSLRDDEGEIVSILSLAQDVTSRVLAEERLVHQATHDSLTGLPNRNMLQERLRLSIARARRSGHRVAAMFIDLDRFKDVNDTLGHRVGDELLREIANRLGRVVRDVDLLVRLSGDEFMVVLEEVVDLASPSVVAAKLLNEIRLPTRIDGHEIHVSGSIGISIFPDDAEDVETLLRNADLAMYRAKELGKDASQTFTADLAQRGASMRLLETALRSAVVRNEFELYFQPKVSVSSGAILGAEALLRWHHPTRGVVLPGEFMQLAEETGLIQEIGDWVIRAACDQLMKWQAAGIDTLLLAINLSAGQFRVTQLAQRIASQIGCVGCDPTCLEFEITETSMLRDPEGVGQTMAALRELGIRVAIDDFGTGYSSLSHLKRFPIDTLKIDKSFVADVLHDAGDKAIVTAVIAMAKALDIEVVAEGVETQAQLDLLTELDCAHYQGYHFSKAVRAHDFEQLVRAQRLGK